MNSNLNLIYVEDDRNIRGNYCFVLQTMFKEVFEASSYDDAMSFLEKYDIHVAIIDIRIEGFKTGVELIQKIRQTNLNMKIIVTSAYSTVENLLQLSSLNLSDFLVKPLNKQTFLDTINTSIDKFKTIKIISQKTLAIGSEFTWDFNKKELLKSDEIIKLTKTERDILQIIFSNPSMELSYEFLIDKVWDYDDASHMKSLRTIIYNLRKKLPKDTITTLYNVGYRFD